MTEEVIPEVAKEFDADPKRLAIGGISMGGYGAFDIARVNRGRFCRVGALSGAVAVGGRDSAGSLRRTPRISRHTTWWPPRKRSPSRTCPSRHGSTPARRIPSARDSGVRRQLEAAAADLTAKTWPGGHTGDCWRSHWDDYVRFYSRALARC